jgi:hypothetical protein
MAKPIKRTSKEAADIRTATPALFIPDRFYTDAQVAEQFQISPRTWKRWRAKGQAVRAVEFNRHTHRTPGHALNLLWQSRLENTEPETA